MVAFGFERHSGRVISLARAMLALLFLFAIWFDPSQPTFGATSTFVLIGGYAVMSALIAMLTWRSWWLDATLAGPAHILDVGMFTGLVFLTAGYTSPFFIFFVFILLSAAIRWGWRETAVTAAALTILYVGASVVVTTSLPERFELQGFVIRTGHLLVLSLLIIWFGIHQSTARSQIRLAPAAIASIDRSPIGAGLVAAANATGASQALLVWSDSVSGDEQLLTYRMGDGQIAKFKSPIRSGGSRKPYLYDIRENRAITGLSGRMPQFLQAARLLDLEAATKLGITSGLAVPLRLETGVGEIFLQAIKDLSLDDLYLAEDLSRDIAGYVQRHALLQAVEESGEGRARLSFARDLHDSVVQFLAGAGFRIEAMIRKASTGAPIESALSELKALMLRQQGELRTYIHALRGGHDIDSEAAANELRSLCQRLSQQWEIDCVCSADLPPEKLPMRLHLDAQQLVREAVSNAVRHGKARRVQVELEAADDSILLRVADDGIGFAPESAEDSMQPRSLRERATEAGGELALASDSGGTSLVVTLPLRGRRT